MSILLNPEQQVAIRVAELMCVAARTAPKACGVNRPEVKLAHAIPLSIKGKNIFFDRAPKPSC